MRLYTCNECPYIGNLEIRGTCPQCDSETQMEQIEAVLDGPISPPEELAQLTGNDDRLDREALTRGEDDWRNDDDAQALIDAINDDRR